MRGLLLLALAILAGAEDVPRESPAHQVLTWPVPGPTPARLQMDGVERASVVVEGRAVIRHAPRRVGEFPWTITGPDGQVQARGSLRVVPAPGGPVRVVGRRLAQPDGAPFLPLGPNLAWMEGDDPVPAFRRAFARLAAGGGNHARVWLCSWSLGLGDDLDPRRQAQVDAVLAAARAHGIRLTLVLENHTDLLRQPGWSAVPLRSALRQRLDLAVARWGADDTVLAWELGNELDLAEPDPERLDAWLMAAAQHLQAIDPDRRPIIASWAHDGWTTTRAPLAWVGVHPYVHEFAEGDEAFKARSRDAVTAFEDAARQGRLWWAMEGGYQGRVDHNPGNDLDVDGLLFQQQLWAGFCLGLGAGMSWWWDTHLEARHLWPRYGALGRIAARLDWRDRQLAQFPPNEGGALRVLGWTAPDQALLWPQVRADTWYRHLVEGQPRRGLPHRQTVRLGGFRPGRTYAWERWHAVAGTPGPTTILTADPQGLLAPVLEPGVVDEAWVLRLTGLKVE